VATHNGRVRAATKRELRRSLRILRRQAGGSTASVSPQLQAIAQCESGGDPTAIGGGGLYRGKYQFTYGTWQSVGGTGDPAAAPEAEQDRRAAILLSRDGAGQWPVCGG
jgi:Transglycosylase-like domain